MSIQQLLNPANVENRASRLHSYSQTVKVLNLDVPGGSVNMVPPDPGSLGLVLTSDGAGGVFWGSSDPSGIPNRIISADLSSSVICNNGSDIEATGNMNMNGGTISNPSSIDTTAARLDLMTPTTVVKMGNDIITLRAATEGQDSLMTLSSGSCIIDVDAGAGEANRVDINPVATILKDPAAVEKLAISATGVKISGAYTLPEVAGNASYVLRSDGAGGTSWTPDGPGGFSDKIISADLSSSITCGNINSISVVGDMNMNGGRFLGASSIETGGNTLDIITPTSAILNGNNAVLISAFSGGAQQTEVSTRPTIYEVTMNTGLGDRQRYTIDGTAAISRDPAGNEKLRVSTSGVRIANAYTLPTVVGDPGSILTSNGAGLATWVPQTIVNPFDQELNTFNDVAFNSVQSNILDSSGLLRIGNTSATAIDLGRGGLSVNIFGIARISNAYTLPTIAGTNGFVLTSNGAGLASWAAPVSGNPFNQNLNTSDGVEFFSVATTLVDSATTLGMGTALATAVNIGRPASTTTIFGTTSINNAYTLPNIPGALGQLLTANGAGGSSWQSPAIAPLIQSLDATAVLSCLTSTISATVNSVSRILVSGTSTTIQSSNGATNRLELVGNTVSLVANGVGILQNDINTTYLRSPSGNQITIDNAVIRISGLYELPISAGSVGQVLTKTGAQSTAWQTPAGVQSIFSGAAAPITVSNTAVLTAITQGGSGSTVVGIGIITANTSYVVKCAGTFRNNANNTALTFRLGTLPLFNSGPILLPNIPAVIGWNAEFWITFRGGANAITSFKLSYTGTNAPTIQQITSLFNPAAATDFGVFVQWGVANANNTLTCDVMSIIKTF